MMSEGRKPLSPKRQRFVQEYLIDLNATAAYKRAGYKAQGHAAESAAERMLRNVEVADAIREAMEARAKRTQITADEVLTSWASIARADPNELVELRRVCCRHCHGAGFLFQRTPAEMLAARRVWEAGAKAAQAGTGPAPEPFDEQGGVGFDARKPPHPDCPECFGEGVLVQFFKDTRNLSPGARLLYAGSDETKDGIKVKTHDQDAARINLARHLGMFVTKHEVSGPRGGAIPIEIVGIEIAESPDSAAKEGKDDGNAL